MKKAFHEIPGSVIAPKGFLASGVYCDIKRIGTGKGSNKGRKRDLALIFSETPATVAGMFTTNQVCAAPVKVCQARVKSGRARAIVINSGNANACTGPQGLRDAKAMTELTARLCRMRASDVNGWRASVMSHMARPPAKLPQNSVPVPCVVDIATPPSS